MDRRRATISSLSVLILGVILFFVACTHASDTVEMCSYISELNELQISVECLETVAGFEHYYYLGPREFMAKLQRVERRVKKRRWLTEEEDLLWVMVRDKMRTMVLEGITREFLPKSGMPATCAIVRALGFRYGFCTYLYLIGLTSETMTMMMICTVSTIFLRAYSRFFTAVSSVKAVQKTPRNPPQHLPLPRPLLFLQEQE